MRQLGGCCFEIRELSAWFSGWRCWGNPLSANRGWMTSRNSWTLIDSSQDPPSLALPSLYPSHTLQDLRASMPHDIHNLHNYYCHPEIQLLSLVPPLCPCEATSWDSFLSICFNMWHTWHGFTPFYILWRVFIDVTGVLCVWCYRADLFHHAAFLNNRNKYFRKQMIQSLVFSPYSSWRTEFIRRSNMKGYFPVRKNTINLTLNLT
jgi:hypothetical protein